MVILMLDKVMNRLLSTSQVWHSLTGFSSRPMAESEVSLYSPEMNNMQSHLLHSFFSELFIHSILKYFD